MTDFKSLPEKLTTHLIIFFILTVLGGVLILQVKKIITGSLKENCYLIYNHENLLIVDPGDDADLIKQEIKNANVKPLAILITHAHHDHVGALEEMRSFYRIPVYISPIEQSWLENPDLNLSGSARNVEIANVICRKAEYELENYKIYTLGGMTFKVVPTPGHSPGSISFIFNNFVITGDTLFSGSIGITDLKFGNMETLKNSIKTEILTLPDNFIVYPGHRDSTTIAKEKKTNPFFKKDV